jgi:cellulose synthase operon protein C
MERLVPRRLVVSLALGWCALAAARVPEWPLANQELIHNARFWEAHDRGDLAQLALQKLVAARPDLPEALLELGELDLRLNDFAAAREVESELDRRFPGSESARDFASEVRVATRDRLAFASIRRLVEIGRTSEARARLKRFFPQGPPGGALGIDYYLLLAQTPGGMAPARAGLRHLAESHGGDPRYQLALARLLVRQRDSALAGVTLLEQLTRRADVRQEDADRLLASGLLRLGPERAPAAAVDAYLARHPEDAEIAGLRAARERLQEERGLLVPAALAKALPVVQRRLERDLSSAAASVSAEVRAEARRWLDRSRAALARGEEPRAALELRAALAFFRGNYEAQIGIAKELATSRFDAEAGELLAAAAHLAPASSWLFETRVRWLIAHEETAAALELVRTRPLTATWTAAARDALLAAALEQRASDETSADQPAAAAADLEAAIPLAPRDPWIRYRLAELYRDRGEAQRGRSLMSDGVARAPDLPDMRYAQALYLSHLEDYAAALAAIAGVDASRRTEGMTALHDRMQVTLARDSARRLAQAGDPAGARTALLDAEPVAARSFDRAVELAHSWIDLGDAAHGIGLVEPYLQGAGGHDAHVLLGWAEVLSSAEDDARLRTALAQLHALPSLGAEQGAEVRRLERALDLRDIRQLERHKRFADAGRRLDALLTAEPHDRQLRIARAELELAAGRPRAARDRLASLTAEDPDDLDVRLSYVRALTESGDVALARAQLEAVEARMPSGDAELELSLARRQLALGAPGKALHTLEPLLAAASPRTDVLMLAGRAQLALHHLREARGYFDRAAEGASGADALAARRESQQVEERLQSSVSGGLLVWHQPGSPGMSQIDAATLPSSWVLAQSDGARFIARADAVWLDAGSWSAAAEPLLGTVELAAAGTALRSTRYTQEGLSPALGLQTDSLAVDVGATPLGFLLPNVVGGIEWTPAWRAVDLTLGIARRAVTSSELSYAGLKDPVTGTSWGGVVQTGPYAGFGIYRESYDVSGSVRFSEITGTRLPDNQLAAARLGTSWKFLSREAMHADAGVTINYWNYERNLSNYTFGSGGYYSPQSYLSLSTPVELTGERAGWSYRLRGAVSYTVSQVSTIAFYPDDASLEAEAARSALPAGYSSPYYPGYRSSGFGFSAYAAAERQLSEALVFGVVADIDRTDYYHPTSIGVYFRHAFGTGTTRSASPPRPIVPYNP